MLNDRNHAAIDALSTTSGGLSRPLSYGRWHVPESVQLIDENLVWHWSNGSRWVSQDHRLFEHFIALGDPHCAGDPHRFNAKVLRFAQRWGVFEICEHGMPSCHNPADPSFDSMGCSPLVWRHKPMARYEPIRNWKPILSQFRALLCVAGKLHSGEALLSTS